MKRMICISQVASPVPPDFYLPDDYWEHIFQFLSDDFKTISLVSKQFLSITNRLRYSLTLRLSDLPFISTFFQRFTNLTSLTLPDFCDDIDILLLKISRFPLKITSLNLSKQLKFPACGLTAFSQNIQTLTSLTCSGFAYCDHNYQFFLIAHCFPMLQILDLSNTKCLKIRWKFQAEVKFSSQFSKLEVLHLSSTTVDDQQLYTISKACSGLLQLLLKNCPYVTQKGVKHVLQNCTLLRKIDIRWCPRVHSKIVPSMVLSRPSLTTIRATRRYILSDSDKKLFALQGCIIG